jgi:CheY-like chemotaxis protein
VNASDALPGGGTIDVDVTRSSTDGTDGHAMLTVSDTGVGMDVETRSHAFDPFFTTKGLGGTGLGLATVYGIVEQSGGHVTVESELGVGTTFSVFLPLVDEAPEDADAQPAAPAAKGGDARTVLLAEDDVRVRELLSRLLEVGGYTVRVAADGPEALEIAGRFEGTIDLLVTDAVMPGIHGRELADRLCAFLPGLKVLFVSGYTDDALVTVAASPSRRFLQKPFTHQELLETVAELLGPGEALRGIA